MSRPLLAPLLLAPALAIGLPSTAASSHPVVIFGVAKALGLVVGGTKLTDMQANWAYRRAERLGSCAERRQRLVDLLPDAIRLARYARDVYADPTDAPFSAKTKVIDLGGGRTGHFEPDGQRFAEVRIEPDRNEVVVVFRGTRLNVGSDLSTDALSLVGIETGYYRWAAGLVARVKKQHPGARIVVTGHSLGGGLVIYSVLHNPGVEGVAFDPVGLSWVTWLGASRADRIRASGALTIVAARNSEHLEPLTALSFARRTVLPGRPVLVEVDASGPIALHSSEKLLAGLEKLAANGASGKACEGVLAQRSN